MKIKTEYTKNIQICFFKQLQTVILKYISIIVAVNHDFNSKTNVCIHNMLLIRHMHKVKQSFIKNYIFNQ